MREYMPTVPVPPGQSQDLGCCPGSKGRRENVPGVVHLMHFVRLHDLCGVYM